MSKVTTLVVLGALALHSVVSILGSLLMGLSGDYVANLDHPIQFVGLGTGLLAASAFLAWVAGAHRAARERSPSEVSFAPGLAIGGFLVPLVNLVLPALVIGEIWRVLVGSNPTPVRVWWFGTILILVTYFGLSRIVEPADRIYLQTAGGVTTVVICALTAYVVASIARGQLRVATSRGPVTG